MSQSHPIEGAEILVREFGIQGGIDYALRIAQMDGEDADLYRTIADIIRTKRNRKD